MMIRESLASWPWKKFKTQGGNISLYFLAKLQLFVFQCFQYPMPPFALFITLFCLSGSHIAQFSGEGAKLLLLGDQETRYLLTPAVTLSSPPAPALLDLDMWTLTQDYNWWEIFWFCRCHAFDDIYLSIISSECFTVCIICCMHVWLTAGYSTCLFLSTYVYVSVCLSLALTITLFVFSSNYL